MDAPVLVTSIDGVGTKLQVAQMMGKFDTVGEDIVNHSINDILVQGAKPLYFTDYIGCGVLDADAMADVMQGLFKACHENDCELIGGETAEMPGLYQGSDFDLVGAITGVVEKTKIINGQSLKEGDVLIGLGSNGLHTNGYSLARKVIFDTQGKSVDDACPDSDLSLGEALLKPHTSYLKPVMAILEKIDIKGMAHITGGGVIENIPRILPKGLGASVKKDVLPIPPIFKAIQTWGNIQEEEMYRVFNMGIGLVLVIDQDHQDAVQSELSKHDHPFDVLGYIDSQEGIQIS